MKLTKAQIKSEIKKCGRDPVYFIKNYCKISHPEKGLIPFKTYDFQDDLLKDFNDHRFNIVLKARQLGISTIVAGYIAWLLLFRREKSVVVIATKFEVAANLVRKVKSMINHLPEWVRIAKIKINNQTSFELSNGSWIKASSTNESAGRSEALSLLVIDEAAFVDGLEDLWKGIFPTLSTGGRCIALSTPNGVANWFHETYTKAVTGENDFHHIELPWQVHPERDEEWFEEVTRNLSRRDVAQEHECNFNASGDSVVSPEDIDCLRGLVVEPLTRTGFDRNYWIWEEYQPDFSYMVIADVSRGDGADYSAAHVFKIETMEQVAEYQGKPSTDMYANLLASVGREYGGALLVVENNNIGYNVLEKLIEMNYPNLYYSIKSTHEYVDQLQAEYQSNSVPGFTTSPKTRPLIVAKMEEFIRNKIVKISSTRTVEELSTFIWSNGKAQAQKNKNDDLTMSLAIACWVRDTAITSAVRDVEYNKAMLGSIVVANTKMSNQIPGQIGYRSNLDFSGNSVREQARRQHQMYSWLYKG
jgi:hypothetical protein